MKKKRFNGEGAEECKEIDWGEVAEDKAKSEHPKKSKKSKKNKKKKEEYSFDIEDVEDGFEVEFDASGRRIRVDETQIRKSVDKKIIIKSEELKQNRDKKGFSRFALHFKPEEEESEEELNFRDKKGLNRYRRMGVLPSKTDGPSQFRSESANWKYDGTSDGPNGDTEDSNYEEYGYETIFDKIRHMSTASICSILMAVVLFAMSILTTCKYADYNGFVHKLQAYENMPQYRETLLPSYSDRNIDTLDVELKQATQGTDRARKHLSLVLSSVEKDLKIKLVDGTDSLVRNLTWAVQVTDKNGRSSTFSDDDEDGIIHLTDIGAGDYVVSIVDSENLKGYEFPVIGQQVSVRAKVEYKVIANIRQEIKKESEVNVALEDPNGNQAADVETGTPPEDTVEWVESTRTNYSDGNGDGFEEAYVDLSQTEKLFAKTNFILAALSKFATGARSAFNRRYVIGLPMMSFMQVADNEPADVINSSQDDVIYIEQNYLDDEEAEHSNNVPYIPDDILQMYHELNEFYQSQIPDFSGGTDNTESNDTDTEENIFGGEVKSVTIDRKNANLAIGSSMLLLLEFSPSNALARSIVWTTSDTNIATVSDGVVKGISQGTARITATVNDYMVVYCDVTVSGNGSATRDDAKVMISGATTVGVGERVTLEATCIPSTDIIEKWEVQNPELVDMVMDGNRVRITGLRSGSTVISAYSSSGVYGTIQIRVAMESEREYADEAQLYDSDRNELYVYDGYGYRLAKYRDYKNREFTRFFRKVAEVLYTGWQDIDGYTYYYTKDHERVTGEQVIGGVVYHFDDDGALSRGSGILGIDVSKYQPRINWRSVKASGVSYVIIRCGYRGASTGSLIQDPYFTSHIRGAKDAGLKVGIYFFSTALNETEAVEEASMCAELCSGYGINYPIFIDVESSSRPGYNSLSVAQRTANIKAFCETISSAGYTPGLYANKTWLTEYIDTSSLSCKIWLAQYNAQGPTYRGHYDMWQFTSKGRVEGIDGNVDMNQSYLNY